MDENVLFFFEGHQEALPLYEKFEERVLSEISGVRIRVQKTQISFPTDICSPVFLCKAAEGKGASGGLYRGHLRAGSQGRFAPY